MKTQTSDLCENRLLADGAYFRAQTVTQTSCFQVTFTRLKKTHCGSSTRQHASQTCQRSCRYHTARVSWNKRYWEDNAGFRNYSSCWTSTPPATKLLEIETTTAATLLEIRTTIATYLLGIRNTNVAYLLGIWTTTTYFLEIRTTAASYLFDIRTTTAHLLGGDQNHHCHVLVIRTTATYLLMTGTTNANNLLEIRTTTATCLLVIRLTILDIRATAN